MLWDETRVATRRVNQNYRTQAIVMLSAMGTAQTGGKDAFDKFKKLLESFDGEPD